jgi:pyrroloquinoline quinone biosynthesis protein B
MKVMVLGSGQDAGIPHGGCNCDICSIARDDTKHRRWGPSIAIFDDEVCYLVDASPDIKYQMGMLQYVVNRKGRIPISGILLTHAHYGHISGLWQLGKEAMDDKNIKVYCTSKLKQLLSENYPFSLLIQSKNIEISEIENQKEIDLEKFTCTPILVPHRDEVANTVGFVIHSNRTMVYVPDLDRWTENILREIQNADIAIIDGTFYSQDEIPRFHEVPHPPISETMELFKGIDTEIYFTHINHTNVINTKTKKRKAMEKKGFRVAEDGLLLDI